MLSALTLPDFESLHMNADHTGRILVFDSGVGGLSVYEHIKRHLPDAGVLYVAGSGRISLWRLASRCADRAYRWACARYL